MIQDNFYIYRPTLSYLYHLLSTALCVFAKLTLLFFHINTILLKVVFVKHVEKYQT